MKLGFKIVICCIILVCIGLINSLWTQLDYKNWYEQLNKPNFTPPSSSLVGMIWTSMYILMGFSVGIIWQIGSDSRNGVKFNEAKRGIQLFIIQLLVNMVVPIFFFAFNNLYFLFAAVLLNFVLVIRIISRFYQINKTSAYILLPYSIWLIYAITLDGSLLILN